MDCVCYFSGGGGVDGRTVDEKALGIRNVGFRKRWLEDVAEYVLDVRGFREDCDCGFLFDARSAIARLGAFRLNGWQLKSYQRIGFIV